MMMGSFGRSRQLHLLQKYLLLHVSRRVIVVVVQANFAPGNDLGLLCQVCQLQEIGVARQFRFMRMNADRGVNEIMLRRKSDGAIQCARAVADADGENGFDIILAGARQSSDRGPDRTLPVEMRMGINKHFLCRHQSALLSAIPERSRRVQAE